MNVIVVGAGIFGVTTAIKLSNKFNVTLVDSKSEILDGASKCNHNRLHYGFHYPRSYKTAKQSLEGYELFKKEFNGCILGGFPNYYMIEKDSIVTSDDYKIFCDNLNLDYEIKTPTVKMNKERIHTSFLTKEPIFDFESIKMTLHKQLEKSNVKILLNTTIFKKSQIDDYDIIINTTYGNLNNIHSFYGIDLIKLKLQDVIIPIFKWDVDKIGITIMDGQYCSILPKGFDEGKYLLYNVKHSVIKQTEDYFIPIDWGNETDNEINSHIDKIYDESSKYFNFLNNSNRLGYWRTYRALPINDDDERLSTLFINDINGKKIISVLSGKITTCISTANKINDILSEN